jgi:two-component sensor histidine kinase
VGFIGTVADITERKAREEREHLLMREVNHRAKNILSVVEAIARQTATRRCRPIRSCSFGTNGEEWRSRTLSALNFRISSISLVSRIALDGPKLCLKAASAQSIGLAVHELATNAGKYGALSSASSSLPRLRAIRLWG